MLQSAKPQSEWTAMDPKQPFLHSVHTVGSVWRVINSDNPEELFYDYERAILRCKDRLFRDHHVPCESVRVVQRACGFDIRHCLSWMLTDGTRTISERDYVVGIDLLTLG